MRVSENQRYRQANDKIAKAKSDNAKALDAVSTMKNIHRISDDPTGLSRAIRYRDQIASLDQHVKNMELSKGFMETTEQALSGITDNIVRAKELAIGMANDTNNAASRDAASKEIRQIIDDVLLLGNSSYNSRFVFAGFRNETPPLTEDGNFTGDDGQIFVEVSPGTFKPINLMAKGLFVPAEADRLKGHENMISVLQNLYDGMAENDKSKIQDSMAKLDFHMDKVTSYQATIGGMWNSLNNAQTRVLRDSDAAKVTLSGIEDADAFKVTSEFKQAETTLQGTLLASNKVLQPSLLNFLQ
jgi:flagellar hook-associated protein 3 FlgL